MAASASVDHAQDASAVELFDDLGRTLQLLGRRLDVLLHSDLPAHAHAELCRTRALVGTALHTLRDVTDTLDEQRLAALPVDRALAAVLDRFGRAADTCVALKTSGPVRALPARIGALLVHVTRETVLSIERNGRASVVLVRVTVDGGRVALEIRDDGVDIAQRQGSEWRRSPDLALADMARTVRAAGGVLAVTRCQPRGLAVRVELPLSGAGPGPGPGPGSGSGAGGRAVPAPLPARARARVRPKG